ncbi:MAG: hypothetical protein HKM02_03650 [Pseudomonadales bacterium]|nr:hypothetical protein [Pseudomonadales bacterium]
MTFLFYVLMVVFGLVLYLLPITLNALVVWVSALIVIGPRTFLQAFKAVFWTWLKLTGLVALNILALLLGHGLWLFIIIPLSGLFGLWLALTTYAHHLRCSIAISALIFLVSLVINGLLFSQTPLWLLLHQPHALQQMMHAPGSGVVI